MKQAKMCPAVVLNRFLKICVNIPNTIFKISEALLIRFFVLQTHLDELTLILQINATVHLNLMQ